MQVDVVLLLADAAALADLDRHRARDDVAGGEVLGGGRVTLHEAFALGIDEIAAFAAGALGDEAARAVDAGRVKLDEFHVLHWETCAQHHAAAVAGAGMRRSAGSVGAAVAAGRQDRGLRPEAMQCAVVELERDDAAADALVVHDQVDGEELDVEFGRMAQRLTVHRVQHGVAGAVGRGAGALRLALAVVHGHAAERALIDLAVLGARERHAPMLELVDGFRRVTHHVFDRVLVAEPVRPLDGVVHVPAPVVRMHVAERSRNAALRCNRMRAGRKHFGDAGGAQARFRAADYGAQAGTAGADHHDVVGVVLDRIGFTVGGGTTSDSATAVGGLAVALSSRPLSSHGLHSR